MITIDDEIIKIDALDFRNNKSQLLLSYILRLTGVFLFGLLFMLCISLIKPTLSMNIDTLFNIKIANLPSVASIMLLIFDVILVLYIHELIHASIFYLTHGQKPEIGIRGAVIFAAAPSHLLKRHQLVINALSPFILISLLGGVALVILPIHLMAWIFIPVVVNAAASGGDFMAVAWAVRHSKQVLYNDEGDIITAYKK